DVPLFQLLERRRHRMADRCIAAFHNAGGDGLGDEIEQRCGTRSDGMEAMAETGNALLSGVHLAPDQYDRCGHKIAFGARFRVDGAVELHALLASAAVDVVPEL